MRKFTVLLLFLVIYTTSNAQWITDSLQFWRINVNVTDLNNNIPTDAKVYVAYGTTSDTTNAIRVYYDFAENTYVVGDAMCSPAYADTMGLWEINDSLTISVMAVDCDNVVHSQTLSNYYGSGVLISDVAIQICHVASCTVNMYQSEIFSGAALNLIILPAMSPAPNLKIIDWGDGEIDTVAQSDNNGHHYYDGFNPVWSQVCVTVSNNSGCVQQKCMPVYTGLPDINMTNDCNADFIATPDNVGAFEMSMFANLDEETHGYNWYVNTDTGYVCLSIGPPWNHAFAMDMLANNTYEVCLLAYTTNQMCFTCKDVFLWTAQNIRFDGAAMPDCVPEGWHGSNPVDVTAFKYNDVDSLYYVATNFDTKYNGAFIDSTITEEGNYLVRVGYDTLSPLHNAYFPSYPCTANNSIANTCNSLTPFWYNSMEIPMYIDFAGLLDAYYFVGKVDSTWGPGVINGLVDWNDTLHLKSLGLPTGANVFAMTDENTVAGYGTTNEDGHFVITGLPIGSYHLKVDYIGYFSTEEDVEITPQNTQYQSAHLSVYKHVLTSVAEHAVTQGEPYPNPTNGNIFIPVTAKKASQLNFTVYNLLGQPVLSQNNAVSVGSQLISLNTEGFAQGIYILQMTDKKTGTVVTKKIVKE